MTDNKTAAANASFLIVARDVLVGQDLAQTIADNRPRARVIIVTTLEDAIGALKDVATIEIAFIAAEPEALACSSVGPAVAMRGGQVVLLGAWADQLPATASWKLLPSPFTTEDVRGVIAAQ